MTTDIEKDFESAVHFVANSKAAFSPTPATKLEFYALYKQAKSGDCNQPKPSFFDLVGKAKWDSWKNLASMNKTDAMNAYVRKLTDSVPAWREWKTPAGSAKSTDNLGGSNSAESKPEYSNSFNSDMSPVRNLSHDLEDSNVMMHDGGASAGVGTKHPPPHLNLSAVNISGAYSKMERSPSSDLAYTVMEERTRSELEELKDQVCRDAARLNDLELKLLEMVSDADRAIQTASNANPVGFKSSRDSMTALVGNMEEQLVAREREWASFEKVLSGRLDDQHQHAAFSNRLLSESMESIAPRNPPHPILKYSAYLLPAAIAIGTYWWSSRSRGRR